MADPTSAQTTTVQDMAAPVLHSLHQATLAIVTRHLNTVRTPESLAGIHRETMALAELANDKLRAAQRQVDPKGRDVACRQGCAWCCHFLVTTTAPTLFVLARRLRTDLPPSARAPIAALAAAGHDAPDPPGAPDGLALRCLLLDGSACRFYTDRPLTCRAHNAFDAAECEAKYHDMGKIVHGFDLPGRAEAAMLAAMAEAFEQAGLDPADATIELRTGLHIALSTPDAEQRWLDGERLFAPAHLDGHRGVFGSRLKPLLHRHR